MKGVATVVGQAVRPGSTFKLNKSDQVVRPCEFVDSKVDTRNTGD